GEKKRNNDDKAYRFQIKLANGLMVNQDILKDFVERTLEGKKYINNAKGVEGADSLVVQCKTDQRASTIKKLLGAESLVTITPLKRNSSSLSCDNSIPMLEYPSEAPRKKDKTSTLFSAPTDEKRTSSTKLQTLLTTNIYTLER